MSAIVSPARTASNTPTEPSQAGKADCCPVGLLYLLGAGTVWLAIALALGFLDSLKFHDPGLLADSAYWTYGRVHAACGSALLYGFGVQAALGVGLWLLCQLGRTPLAGPFVVFLGALVWNFAVTVGVIAILCGDNTGFEAFEMPAICAPMLFVSYALIGVCGMLTFHQRQEGPLYPSQWFVVGSLFWFPWIFSTASLLLLYMPVRGVLQASTDWWYAHNLRMVFLGFAGLASSFYFIPKLLGRPLHSRQLAGLAFWTLAVFGSWGGIPDGAPLPSWIASVGVAGTVLTAIPMLAIAVNFYQTACRDLNTLDSSPTLRFTYVGLLFLIIAGAQQIVGALPQVSAITSLTWFGVAQKELFDLGFFAMTVFGAIYYIVPRLLGIDSQTWCPKLAKVHFYLTGIGILISYLALLVGGIGQGILLAAPGHSFVQVMQGTLMPLRMSTLGDLMFLAGTVVFLVNFAWVVGTWCRQCCVAARKEAK
ncbi:MAG TPA: cbb3-type cytochrome c oxidase subunit I [Candidatus Baltobacteraceae bacterium]|jgi:cytochrome c oxidase cbb3-type subunit 1|nr:cbb3-type cytochrome c oxidase subunit I [Candidatus Baltobacteraceae bacterium]